MRDDEFLAMQKSTIVRTSIDTPVLPPVRLVVGTLSRIAPGLAARLAARLFLRPRRHRPPAYEVVALASARAGEVRVDGLGVRTWTWGAGPAVLLVHGWSGRGAQLAAFAPPLVERGFAVTTFDAPGHGASGGREATIPQLVAAIRAVAAPHGTLAGLVAHSVGALAAARALYEGLGARAAVFVGPPADVSEPAMRFHEALGLTRRARERMRELIEAKVGAPWSAFDVTHLAPALDTPLFVVHDRGDGEVPWQSGWLVARAWPRARFETTDGLGHRRILRDGGVVAAAVAFVAAHADAGRRSLAVAESAGRAVATAA